MCHKEVEDAEAWAWSNWLEWVGITNPELHERIANNLGLAHCTGTARYLLPDSQVVVCEVCMMPYARDTRCAYCGEAVDPPCRCSNGCAPSQNCMPDVPGITLTSFIRLLEATRVLAQGTGDIQQRLYFSYVGCLKPPGLDEDLSEDLRTVCEQLHTRMMYAGSPDM